MKIELLKPHTMNSHRLNSNPEERRLLEAWAKEQERGIDRSLLSHLLSPSSTGLSTGHPSLSGHPEPSDRDYLVAGTVIQWLGSPVGQGFLRDLYGNQRVG